MKKIFTGLIMFLSRDFSGFKVMMLKIWAMGLGLGGRKQMAGAEEKRKLNTQLENWQVSLFHHYIDVHKRSVLQSDLMTLVKQQAVALNGIFKFPFC